MWEWLTSAWPHVTSVVVLGATLVSAWHAVLHKRDVRAAIGWTGLIVLVPGVGALIYMLLGVNRIERRGARLRTASANSTPDEGAGVSRASAGDVGKGGGEPPAIGAAPHLD